jgi:outer membrane protein insertion porin family
MVTAVEVKGLKRIEEGSIRAKLAQKIGRSLSQENTTEDIKTIYKMGYFNDVRVEIEPFEGGVKLIYAVKEKPTIVKVDLQGNKEYDDDRLREKVTITPGSISDATLINYGAAKLRSFYESEGYYLAVIVPVISVVKEGEVALTYQIEEGQKVRISDIVITGNDAMSGDKIIKVMKTKTAGLFSFILGTGYYKKEEMKLDSENIKDLYYNNGFLKITVSEPELELSQDRTALKITLRISEGVRFTVASVGIEGNKTFSEKDLSAMTKLAPGAVFSKEVLGKDIAALTEKYADNGHALVSIYPDLLPDDEKKTVRVAYKIDEGAVYRIGRINILGNTKTMDKVIRREVRLDEDDLYKASAINRSQERLNNLQYFEPVAIEQKPKAEDKLVDLDIKVKEKPTGFFSIGGGYSSVDRFVGMADVTFGNFLGAGYLLKVKGQLGGTSSYYDLSFNNPWFMDKPISFTTNIYKSKREYGNFDKDATGFGVSFGRRFWEYWHESIGYNIEKATVYNIDNRSSIYVKSQEGTKTTSSISYSIGRDTRNNYLDPVRGSKIALYGTFAGLGGDNAFVKSKMDAGRYFPVLESSTIHLRGVMAAAGGIFGKDLPIYERYYVGGIDTVRGLGYGNGGPKDINGEPIGGFKELVMNLEYIFPIAQELRFKGVAFFDAGRAYGKDETFGSDLRYAAGAGIRWISPIGPIRVEWGRNLMPRTGEASSRVEFTFGSFF